MWEWIQRLWASRWIYNSVPVGLSLSASGAAGRKLQENLVFFIYHFTNNSFGYGFQIWGLLDFMMLLQTIDKGKVAGSEGSIVFSLGNQWL